jgi:hypothetical protein
MIASRRLATRARRLSIGLALVIVASASASPVVAATASPHMFGPDDNRCLKYGDGHKTCSYHNDSGTVYKDIPSQSATWTWKWPSTSTTFYNGLFKFDSSFPDGWKDAVRRAVGEWNTQSYLSPWMSETTGSTFDILIKYSTSSACSGLVWYACANIRHDSTASKAQAEAHQWWIITLNPDYSFGVGATGKFDVQSILTNELGHAWYINHNNSWTSGVVQLQSCKWGSTSCKDSAGRTVTCDNCGNRRSALSGDQMTLGHIYGAMPASGSLLGGRAKAQPARSPDTSATPNDMRVTVSSIAIPEAPQP